MSLRRLSFAFAGIAAMLCLSGPAALGQAKYPNRPVRIIVPLPPGGAIDVFVRGLGKEFETRTGASVVVENRAGANTIIAANACKAATPDGYTFCLLTRSTWRRRNRGGSNDHVRVTRIWQASRLVGRGSHANSTRFASFSPFGGRRSTHAAFFPLPTISWY